MNAHDASELAFKNGYAAGFKAAEEHYQLEIKALQAANKGMYTASCEMDAQIAKLTAERDAAVAELTNQSACWTCKKNADCHSRPVEEPSIRCGLFEWRGLSLAVETSDKEVE